MKTNGFHIVREKDLDYEMRKRLRESEIVRVDKREMKIYFYLILLFNFLTAKLR